MSLSDKETEILLAEDIYFRGYPKKDVKETFKKLKAFCNIHKGTLVCADTFLEVMIEEAGKELCEEVARE